MLSLCEPFLTTPASFFFFFNDTATTEIYTLSLHDALPIYPDRGPTHGVQGSRRGTAQPVRTRSEEHTSELQSQSNIVCRLLLGKKKLNHKSQSPLWLRLTRPTLLVGVLSCIQITSFDHNS